MTESPRFRSGTVARLLGMPVATLRVWERRYRVCGAGTSPGGHRLYGPDDLERLRRLRALTEAGHAISAIAGLDLAALDRLARLAALPAEGGWRVGVIGAELAQRLGHWRAGPVPAAVYEGLDAWQAEGPTRPAADALLVGMPTLDAAAWARLRGLAFAGGPRLGIAYRFAPTQVLRDAEALGVALLREPADAPQVARWLQALAGAPAAPAGPLAPPVSPPRFTEAELSRLAALAPARGCECPRHVAELALQLAHFEAYSARCVDGHPADAALHRALHAAAAQARQAIETAVALVMAHELA